MTSPSPAHDIVKGSEVKSALHSPHFLSICALICAGRVGYRDTAHFKIRSLILNDLLGNKHPADTQRLECACVGHMTTCDKTRTKALEQIYINLDSIIWNDKQFITVIFFFQASVTEASCWYEKRTGVHVSIRGSSVIVGLHSAHAPSRTIKSKRGWEVGEGTDSSWFF